MSMYLQPFCKRAWHSLPPWSDAGGGTHGGGAAGELGSQWAAEQEQEQEQEADVTLLSPLHRRVVYGSNLVDHW